MVTAASFWEQKDELIENLKKIKRRIKGNGGETDTNWFWETKLEGCVLDVQKEFYMQRTSIRTNIANL